MALGNGGVIVCDTEGSSTAHANYISEGTVDVCGRLKSDVACDCIRRSTAHADDAV
jgi:hypothetical protein